MWRHLPTWRQGVRWRGWTWRQNVASLGYVASGSQVAWPDVASKRGVTCPRGVREPGGVAGRGVKTWRHWPTRRQGVRWRGWTWRQNVASLAYVASGSQVASRQNLRYVREPRAVAGALPSLTRAASGVAERGVKMWRHLPTWRQGATGRRWTWRQAPSIYVASQDVASKRGVTKPGLPARVFKMCLQSSGDMCTPTGDHPAF